MNHSDMRKLRTTFASNHLPSRFRGNTGAQSVALFGTRMPTKAERALCGFEFPPSQLPTSENRRHVRGFIYRGGACSGRIKYKVVYCNNGYIYNLYIYIYNICTIIILTTDPDHGCPTTQCHTEEHAQLQLGPRNDREKARQAGRNLNE